MINFLRERYEDARDDLEIAWRLAQSAGDEGLATQAEGLLRKVEALLDAFQPFGWGLSREGLPASGTARATLDPSKDFGAALTSSAASQGAAVCTPFWLMSGSPVRRRSDAIPLQAGWFPT